ncbi:MAG: sulfite exporter TauE/SafE family protein [Phycisphaeraceae bacterium]|nr:sulfite exporter TauE/SafE family protein [Phycisphaeraceae bacterium]
MICNLSWLPTPPADTSVWLYYSLVIAAVIVMGIAKSGFGGGVGILAVPLIANAMPADRALGVMLPILIVADTFAVYQHRKQQSWPHLRPALLGGIVGIGIGTLLLFMLIDGSSKTESSENVGAVLSIFVGSICLLMVAVQVYRLSGGKVPTLPGNKPTGVGVGAAAGFTSMLAHAAGPIMSIYWLDQKMGKRLLTGSLVLYFILINTLKLPSYFALGWITLDSLKESAVFALFVPIGSLLGIVMHHRIPEKPFTAVMYAGAAVAGAWLIVKVII